MRLVLLLFVSLLVGAPVVANPVKTEKTVAALIAETNSVAPGKSLTVALSLEPIPGWHTYWRNPGDSGIPTSIRWTLPEGFSAGAIQWPRPEAIRVGPLMNYGYHGAARLLIEITSPQELGPGPARLEAKADWLVCEEICIPESATLILDLPAGDGAAEAGRAAYFAEARSRLPEPAPFAAAFFETAERFRLLFSGEDRPGEDAAFFPYEDGTIDHAAEQTAAPAGDGLQLSTARGYAELGEIVAGVVADGDGAWEIAATRSAGPFPETAAGAEAGASLGVGVALLFAFLGGLILNLMPCVFPILSLKALALARQGAAGRGEAAREGLVFTAGVVLSFAAIAGVFLSLRAGGAAIGWGFQLQSPGFVALLAYVMFAVGLSLSGALKLSGGFAGAGQSLAALPGHAGAFFTGALAALVATPCTAPFMAAALGYAAARPALEAMAVFLALGFGLAFPFLAVSLSPGLRRLLPKPGAWMERFRQALAFPMYASAVWLIWVLAQQSGAAGVLMALAGLVLIAFSAWAWPLLREAQGGLARLLLRLAAAAALLLALVLAQAQAPTESAAEADAARYSESALNAARAENRPVFVNFTAAWCVTCLVNERVALETETVRTAFRDRGVLYLKGDWTNRDSEITRALEGFSRSGVPLYLYYPPGGGEPEILPQILTPGIVLDALDAR